MIYINCILAKESAFVVVMSCHVMSCVVFLYNDLFSLCSSQRIFVLVVFLPKLGHAIDAQSAVHTSVSIRLTPQTPSTCNS
jgi:hypothetical protein